MHDEIFPTEFACRVGEDCKLLEKHGPKMDATKYVVRRRMMQEFQQMAMASPMDECLIVFYGMKLKEKHMQCLELVYKSTRPWTMGRAATVLLKKLHSPTVSGKDSKELVSAIKEHLVPGNVHSSDGVPAVSRGSFTVVGTFEDPSPKK